MEITEIFNFSKNKYISFDKKIFLFKKNVFLLSESESLIFSLKILPSYFKDVFEIEDNDLMTAKESPELNKKFEDLNTLFSKMGYESLFINSKELVEFIENEYRSIGRINKIRAKITPEYFDFHPIKSKSVHSSKLYPHFPKGQFPCKYFYKEVDLVLLYVALTHKLISGDKIIRIDFLKDENLLRIVGSKGLFKIILK